ncbi:hypothetical protein [Paraclostridium bifermentans]|uniref:hypothetical protein n=1 Tax=Paraclostridium bifermentans TaxID=1490 RepID=UPI001C7E53AA|nr:hypothetical protein [Paraclostridium bifermentans]GIM33924.1 hypothetical protein PAGU1678_31930 [Paraclostridium bifermentans subsp. muricolitidis]
MITIEKVNYILKLQSEGKSRHEIKDTLGYKHLDSMTKYMRKRGYRVENDKYILNDDSCHQVENVKINPIYTFDDNSVTINNANNIKQDMIEIVEHKSEIFDMLNWFKNRDDNSMTEVIEVINEGIKIDLPESETTRTTIRINKIIWDEFDLFCSENKEFNKQDLMAQALKDFMYNIRK